MNWTAVSLFQIRGRIKRIRPNFVLDLNEIDLPMKTPRWIALFCVLLSGMTVTLWGQPGRGDGNPPSFVGRVVDGITAEPISFASIAVLSAADSSIVTGTLASEDGLFRTDGLAPGSYIVQVSFMGYKTWLQANEYRPGPPVRLGDIAMEASITNLDEAVVVEQQSTLEMKIDRRVFNVGSDLTSTGANASELLTNVPSVSVDIDGNVFLRGSSNVQILIDGRPSGLTGAAGNAFLQQLPASSIERVEVITNPSAKFDPDGMAGILNIVLRKEKRSGFNGSAQTSVANGGNIDGNLSLNTRTESYNLYSSFGWGQRNRTSNHQSTREQTILDETSTLTQDRSGFDTGGGWTGRVGGDWFPSEGTTWSLSLSGNLNDDWDRDTLLNAQTWNAGNAIETIRYTNETEDNWGWDADLSFRKEFEGNRNHNLLVALRQSDSEGKTFQDLQEITTHLDSALQTTDFNDTQDRQGRTVFSIDYEKPLSGEGRLELGWKSNVSLNRSDFAYIAVDSLTYDEGLYLQWNPVPDSYEFEYREAVHAAYGTWGQQWGVWGMSAGLRLEQVFTDASVLNSATPVFENDYFSLYPSLNVSRQRNDENTWIASYSRRVNRPRGRQVNPFVNDADPRNIRVGNPSLLPEYTHSMEFGHQWSRGRTSITTSLFLKHTTDVIRHYSTFDSLGVRTSSYTNFASRRDEGLEVIGMTNLGETGSLRVTASLYHLANDVGDAAAASNSQGWSGDLNGFASWTMGPFWKAQVNGMYRAPSITPQGRFNGYKYLDVALSRTFLDQSLTATCRVSDVFDTREWSYNVGADDFRQDSRHKRQSRFVYLTVQWRFGQMDNRRDRSGRGDGFGGGMDGGMEF